VGIDPPINERKTAAVAAAKYRHVTLFYNVFYGLAGLLHVLTGATDRVLTGRQTEDCEEQQKQHAAG
jgi:hypothetical protein